MEYLKYGGFPSLIYEEDYNEIIIELNHMVQKVVNVDMTHIKNFTTENQANANKNYYDF